MRMRNGRRHRHVPGWTEIAANFKTELDSEIVDSESANPTDSPLDGYVERPEDNTTGLSPMAEPKPPTELPDDGSPQEFL